MIRETAEMEQAYKACLDGASVVNTVIATHNLGADATRDNFAFDLTHEEKKERVTRSVGYLKYQKDTYSDWGDKDFTAIDAAITAADNFTS